MELMFSRHLEDVYLVEANEMEYCIENDQEPIDVLKVGRKSSSETEHVLGCNSLLDFEAAFIFHPAVMKKVAEVLADDFYIIPACTDNVVIAQSHIGS